MNISVKFDEIQINIRDVQQSIAFIRQVDLEPGDFYKRMVQLTNDHPDAYEIVQAMIMLFSKMETSNKIFKERVLEYSEHGLKLKQNTVEIVQEHMKLINELNNTIAGCKLLEKEMRKEATLTERKALRLMTNFNNYIAEPKNFGKFLVGALTIIIFFLFLAFEAYQPKLLHSTLNSVTSVLKGDYITEDKNVSK